jgi:predicted TIM-barrel fold metal-dependent hydrolase
MPELGRRDFLMSSLAATIPNYRIIDPHVHVWKHDPQFPWAKETTHPPDGDATPEMLLALMKQHGVEKTVLIQYIGYRWDNSFVADVLKRYPKYFKGVCRVDPLDAASPDKLAQLVEQGFRGVRLSPAGDASGDWIRGPLMPPLWERCSRLKVPMTILAPVTRMPDVARLADRLPDLTIVIDHMADCPIDQPQQLDLLLALERYAKLFVKISHTWSISKQPYPYADAQQFVKRLYEKFGPQRLMWATDWPIVERAANYTKALTVVRDEMKFLNAEDKRWILSKTIERVWPFD